MFSAVVAVAYILFGRFGRGSARCCGYGNLYVLDSIFNLSIHLISCNGGRLVVVVVYSVLWLRQSLCP